MDIPAAALGKRYLLHYSNLGNENQSLDYGCTCCIGKNKTRTAKSWLVEGRGIVCVGHYFIYKLGTVPGG